MCKGDNTCKNTLYKMLKQNTFLVFFLLFSGIGVERCFGDFRDGAADAGLDDRKMHKFPSHIREKLDEIEHEPAEFWIKSAQEELAAKLKSNDMRIEAMAKNTIFFLGDGMSVPTLAAARIYKGQLEKLPFGGEEATLSFEKFPNIGISKTYCADLQTSESACTATAYLTGVKAKSGTIGVGPEVNEGDCEAMMNVDSHVESVLAWAQAAGKSTGVITTTRITHASPSGTYAHTADRDWENDAAVKSAGFDPKDCEDIASQLINKSPGQNINVILGGGRNQFTPNTVRDPETNSTGKRTDDQDLIQKWIKNKQDQNVRAQYVWNRTEFEKVDPKNVDFLFGLFNEDHLDFVLDSQEDPSLPELTKKAIEILSKNPKGFFLFVEGGRIDHAHHEGRAQKALMETVVLAEAVEVAANMTNVTDTLIVVTADHSHTLSVSGYPARGNELLGLSGDMGDDEMPYMTLNYANGPGYRRPETGTGKRYNPEQDSDQFHDKEYRQPSLLPEGSETHGGDDVLIFARGPFSHLLSGVVEQSYIPHVIGYANAIGPGLKFEEKKDEGGSATTVKLSLVAILISIVVQIHFCAFNFD